MFGTWTPDILGVDGTSDRTNNTLLSTHSTHKTPTHTRLWVVALRAAARVSGTEQDSDYAVHNARYCR